MCCRAFSCAANVNRSKHYNAGPKSRFSASKKKRCVLFTRFQMSNLCNLNWNQSPLLFFLLGACFSLAVPNLLTPYNLLIILLLYQQTVAFFQLWKFPVWCLWHNPHGRGRGAFNLFSICERLWNQIPIWFFDWLIWASNLFREKNAVTAKPAGINCKILCACLCTQSCTKMCAIFLVKARGEKNAGNKPFFSHRCSDQPTPRGLP